ncbi:MAG: hypothetical protein AB7F09_13325 [Parvibaculaceae bacterium]
MANMQGAALALTVVNLGLLAGTLGFGRLAAAPAPEAVVRAELIELVDQTGTVRSRLSVASDGEVVFRMMDQTGAIRVKLGAGTDGSGLVLLDARTEPGIHMLATDKATRLSVKNQAGTETVIAP